MPPAFEGGAIGVGEDEAVVDLVRRGDAGDPPVPKARQPLHGRLRHTFEIEVDPGIGAWRPASTEGNERDLPVEQIVDPSIDPLHVGDDEAVGEPPFDHPTEIGEVGIVGIAKKNEKIELARRDHRAEAVENHDENGVGNGEPPARRQHHRHHSGGALAQTPSPLIGRVAEVRRGLENPLPRLGVDIAAAVQGTGDRADRQVEMPRKIPNVHAEPPVRLSPRAASGGRTAFIEIGMQPFL